MKNNIRKICAMSAAVTFTAAMLAGCGGAMEETGEAVTGANYVQNADNATYADMADVDRGGQ